MKLKVLLIAPLFFDYYQHMITELEDMGYEVDYVCDTHSNSNLTKAIGRVCKGMIRGATGRYYREQVRPRLTVNKYDYVLVVAGMTFSFPVKYVEEMRRLQDAARFVLYLWDSVRNLPYVPGIQTCFDRLFSFDREDCTANPQYSHLPLFYTRPFAEVPPIGEEDCLYDCMYIGTAHPKKYQDINHMSHKLAEVMPRQMIYHYMPSKLKFWYHKCTAREFRGAHFSDFRTEKLSTEEILDYVKASRCILDAPQAGQSGLTMRVIEALGAGRKLITTNADVTAYDFYAPENIYVYDGEFDFEHPFFRMPYQPLPAEIHEKYSLRSWLTALLADEIKETE